MSVDESVGFPRPGRSTERGEGQKPDDTNSADVTLSKPGQPLSGPESGREASEVDPPEMAPVLEDLAAAAEMEAEPENRRDLTMVRRIAVTAWFVLMGVHIALEGLAFDRTRLIILMCLGLAAASIGRRRFITIILDWAPFA